MAEAERQYQVLKGPDGRNFRFPTDPTTEELAQLRQLVPSATESFPPRHRFESKFPKATEAANVAADSIYGGLTFLPRMYQQLRESQSSTPLAKTFRAFHPGTKIQAAATDVISKADDKVRNFIAPRTSAGNTASEYGEAAVGSVMWPGGFAAPLRNAFIGTTSHGGGELMAEAAGDNTFTRITGNVLGGGLGGLATMARTNQKTLAQEAMRDVRERDLETAIQRMNAAKEQGIELNLSQAMPRDSNIDTYVNTLSSSRHGVNTQEQLRNQPRQLQFNAEDTLQSTPGIINQPQVTANAAQAAADSYIRQGIQKAGQAWRDAAPFEGIEIPIEGLRDFDNQLQAMLQGRRNSPSADIIEEVRAVLRLPKQEADEIPGILDSAGNPMREAAPAENFLTDPLELKGAIDGVLNTYGPRKLGTDSLGATESRTAQEIRKLFNGESSLDDLSFLETHGVMPSNHIDLERAHAAGDSIYRFNEMDEIPTEVFNVGDLTQAYDSYLIVPKEVAQQNQGLIGRYVPELAAANKAYETVMSTVVDPAKKSIIGRVAGRQGVQDTVEASQSPIMQVFNRGTTPGSSSSEILTLERSMRQAGNPEAFQNAAKTWLAAKITEAGRSTNNRTPENFAARMVKAFGDPRQATAQSQGFKDILTGLARSQGYNRVDFVQGFQNFMRVTADAARRPGNVSGTTSSEIKELASEGVTRSLGRVSIMTPLRQPALMWARLLESDALTAMDKLLTSPEGARALAVLSKADPYSHRSITAVSTFLGSLAGGSSTLESPEITQ